jgi:hypothetical protein
MAAQCKNMPNIYKVTREWIGALQGSDLLILTMKLRLGWVVQNCIITVF